MKELKFNNSLKDRINTSKMEFNLKEDMILVIKMALIIFISAFLGVFLLLNSLIISGIIGFLGGFGICVGALIKGTKKVKIDSEISKEQLLLLERELQQNGLNLSVDSIQKSLITETKNTTENIDRRNDILMTESVIKRFYMLDDNDQIRVLQETLKTCKLADGSCAEDRSLFLLEEADLENIEMPSIKKNLVFEDK